MACSCMVVDPQCKNVKTQNIKVQADMIPGKTRLQRIS